MANISVTHTFSNGTTADASQVNTNFTDIINGTSDGTKDLSISALTCAGNVSMNGNVTLGNASGDDITFTGSLASNLPIKTDGSYDIGSTSLGLDICYFGDGGGNTVGVDCPAIASNFIFTLPAFTCTMPASDGADGDYMETNASGVLSFVGGPSIDSYTTTQTITTAQKNVSVTTSSGWTLTLYAASGNAGRTVTIFKTSSDNNILTIDGNGSETINGATTFPISLQYEKVTLLCDGSNWVVLEHYIPTVVVFGAGNGGESITSAVTDITWTEVTDSHAAWNGTQFTAPKAGYYQVSGICRTTSATNYGLTSYIGGSASLLLEDDGASTVTTHFQGVEYLEHGEVFSIRTDANVTLASSTASHTLHIILLHP